MSDLIGVTCYLVDADGTLWYTNPIILALRRFAGVVCQFLRERGRKDFDVQEVSRELVSLQNRALAKREFIKAYDWDCLVYEYLTGELKLSSDDAKKLLAELDKYVEEESYNVTLLSGVREVLAELKENNGKIIVLSNGFYKYIYLPLKATGLIKYVDDIITPDVILKDAYFHSWVYPIKPYRSMFVYAMIRGACKRFVMIGDSAADVIGALRSGASRVYLIVEKAIKDYRLDVNVVSEAKRLTGKDLLEVLRMLSEDLSLYNTPETVDADGIICPDIGLKKSIAEVIMVRTWRNILECEMTGTC